MNPSPEFKSLRSVLMNREISLDFGYQCTRSTQKIRLQSQHSFNEEPKAFNFSSSSDNVALITCGQKVQRYTCKEYEHVARNRKKKNFDKL